MNKNVAKCIFTLNDKTKAETTGYFAELDVGLNELNCKMTTFAVFKSAFNLDLGALLDTFIE